MFPAQTLIRIMLRMINVAVAGRDMAVSAICRVVRHTCAPNRTDLMTRSDSPAKHQFPQLG
ncbi:hypothetical protein IMCC12053_538 [Celeribacter marinus]|uniref:Uncharacterized protein n=1 Tax=Celeribacter marinus TaxID=1397108 RepID=A0A0P0A7X7_9RHOB|nr:hypothetical protein IMCC12053_538 [Celeribacter marinus]